LDAGQRIKELVLKLRAEGIHIQYMDLGGGLGITYHQEEPPHPPPRGSPPLPRGPSSPSCTPHPGTGSRG
jgi:diaminopimelate decarboxylase